MLLLLVGTHMWGSLFNETDWTEPKTNLLKHRKMRLSCFPVLRNHCLYHSSTSYNDLVSGKKWRCLLSLIMIDKHHSLWWKSGYVRLSHCRILRNDTNSDAWALGGNWGSFFCDSLTLIVFGLVWSIPWKNVPSHIYAYITPYTNYNPIVVCYYYYITYFSKHGNFKLRFYCMICVIVAM